MCHVSLNICDSCAAIPPRELRFSGLRLQPNAKLKTVGARASIGLTGLSIPANAADGVATDLRTDVSKGKIVLSLGFCERYAGRGVRMRRCTADGSNPVQCTKRVMNVTA